MKYSCDDWDGVTLKELRIKRGWSQRELANEVRAMLIRMGCKAVGTDASVANWEAGAAPGGNTIAALFNIFRKELRGKMYRLFPSKPRARA